MRSGQTTKETPHVQNDIGFELVVTVSYAGGIQLRAKVVGGNDVANYAAEGSRRHADEEPPPRRRVLDHLPHCHGAGFFLLPPECVDDLLVYCKNDWVGLVTVCVRLSHDQPCCVKVTLMHKPSWRLWSSARQLRRTVISKPARLT